MTMVLPFDPPDSRRPIYPLTVTLTGIDASTSRADLESLAWHYAEVNIEVGVLVCAEAHATGWKRYPSTDEAHRLLETANDLGLQTAVHLCGAEAIAAATGGNLELDTQALILSADRLQLNLRESHSGTSNLELAYARFGRGTFGRGCSRVIGQVRNPNEWPRPAFGIDFLFDQSAGTGVAPPSWPTIPTGLTPSGYGLAGGIRPFDGSVARAVRALGPAIRDSNFRVWIDMETGVRTADDQFDPIRCIAVLNEAAYTLRQLALESPTRDPK